MMRAGQMDRRITIERKSSTLSDSGDPIDSWSAIATVWARKIENRGAERFATKQLVGGAVRTFQFRWSDAVKDITVLDRIIFDDREFDIHDVREIGLREGIEVDASAASEEPLAP